MSTASHPTPARQSARQLLSDNLLRLRKSRGWSQEALSYHAGLHRTVITHIERKARNVSLETLERLAATFDVGIHELLLPAV